jgi:hypothetical protein
VNTKPAAKTTRHRARPGKKLCVATFILINLSE